MKKILINGGCGFLGSNLASYGIANGYEVTVFDNLSRLGSAQNLDWLRGLGTFTFVHGDTRNKNDVESMIKAGGFDAVFHLAGQVAMTTSMADPYKDFEINAMGAVNVLDSIRKYSPDTAIFFSSTNKVYGDLDAYSYEETPTRYICKEFPRGFDESVPLDFRSPYGCSKGAADQYMLDFARMFGVRATVFRHSSMYGSRQFATCDQGWIGWFCAKAIEKFQTPACPPFTISGNGKQVRDILHAEDMIRLYYTALEHVDQVFGQAYNIGGGMEQSLSLLELFQMLNKLLDVKLAYTQQAPRQSDQKVFVADIAKINKAIGWQPRVTALAGISKMVDWVRGIV
ncbi:MAG: GDP-mannose 4,6-dehydratase [Ruthenibacterium sp.]